MPASRLDNFQRCYIACFILGSTDNRLKFASLFRANQSAGYMQLRRLHIPRGDKTPEVIFNTSGNLSIKGRAMITKKPEAYSHIMRWIDQYLENPAEMTYLIVALEYLNSFSTTVLSSFFLKISRIVTKNKEYSIQWYYEDGDDDMLERGQYISAVHKIPIKFIPVSDINNI